MHIIVCVKEVPDPDAINNYALVGRLRIAEDGRSIERAGIPLLINAYDEQAIEAALRLRDAGVECAITAVSVGAESARNILRHAASLGADRTALITPPAERYDAYVTAALLAGFVKSLLDTTEAPALVLCGRQASDDDQGIVPALLGEMLGMPVVTMARAVERPREGVLHVTRVTPDGDETVEVSLPALVTISNELGAVRYPTAQAMMAARRKLPAILTAAGLGIEAEELRPRVSLSRIFVPEIQGECELITGDSPAAVAEALLQRLRGDGILA